MAARALDHPRRDRQAVGERSIVMEPARILDQVVRAFHDGASGLRSEPVSHDHPAQALGDLTGRASCEEREQSIFHPLLGLRGAVRVKRVRGTPQVFEHMHDVEHDRDLDPDLVRAAADAPDLIPVAIDEHDPAALAFGVAMQRLGECVVDHALPGVGDA